MNPTQDPNHWASTQSVGQKVGWVIANALGAFGGNNNSAEMMKSAIQNDLQAQQRSFENGKAQADSLYKQAFDLTGNSRDALKLAMNAQLDQAKALAQSWADKYRGQTAGAKADAEVQKINTLISQNTLEGVQEHNKAFHYQPGSGPTLLSATPKFQAKLEELTKAWQANPANAGKPLPIEQLKMDAASLTPGGFGTQAGPSGADYAKAGAKGAGVPRAVQSIAAHEDAAAKNLRDATEALLRDNTAANRANYNAAARAAGVETISEWAPFSPVRESTLDSNLALVQKRGARATANLAGNPGAGEVPDYATRPDGE